MPRTATTIRAITLFALIAPPLASAGEPLKPQDADVPIVRGIHFRATVADVRKTFQLGPNACTEGPHERMCDNEASIGEVKMIDYFWFRDDSLYRIEMNFPTRDYPAIRAAFVEKYGPPVVESDDFQNGFGARFSVERLSWIGRTLVVLLRQSQTPPPFRGTEHGLAEFITRADYDETVALLKEKARKAARDF